MAISLRTNNRPENVYLWHCWVAKIRESGSLFYGFCFRTHTSDGPRDRDQDLRECCLTWKNRDRCNNGGSLIRFSWQFAYSFQIIPISLWGSIQPSFEDWAGVVFILIMSLLSSVIANIFSIAQYNCKSAHYLKFKTNGTFKATITLESKILRKYIPTTEENHPLLKLLKHWWPHQNI